MESFDEAGIACGIVKNLADAIDGGVEAEVEFNVGALWPDHIAHLFASDDLAGVVEKQAQELSRLLR